MQLLEHKQTHQKNDFIRGWYIDTKLCDEIVDYFETKSLQTPGIVKQGVRNDLKKSTDAIFEDKELLTKYSTNLQKVFQEYTNIYPMVNFYSPWGVVEKISIQRYLPGEGFYAWHTERGYPNSKEANRHMVFMTYLNDVVHGGETEFYHQDIKVKAEKGLTLVWPSDWTFTHRGCVSNTETKYITTGWASYY